MSTPADDCITVEAATLPFPGGDRAGVDPATLDEFRRHAERLASVYKSLQSATLTVGYLESTINDYQQKARMLPELEEESRRLSDLEQEYERLSSRAPELDETARLAEACARQNEAMRRKLDELDGDGTPWWSLLADLIAGQEAGGNNRRARRLSMQDYYRMIQLNIDS